MAKKNDKKLLAPGAYLFIPPPPDGYVGALASDSGTSVSTVQRALRMKTYTRRAEAIRQMYYRRYIEPHLI